MLEETPLDVPRLGRFELGSAIHQLILPTVLCLALFWAVSVWDTRRRLPPGPSLLELIIRGKPKVASWIWFSRLSNQYRSAIICIPTLGRDIIVLNSPEAAREVMHQESVSSRPRSIMMELFAKGQRVSMMPNDETWKLHRKLLHRSLNATVAQSYHTYEEQETLFYIENIMKSPDNWSKHAQSMMSNAMQRLSYGIRSDSPGTDPAIQVHRNATERIFLYMAPGRFAVERFPILRSLPTFLAPWKAQVLKDSEATSAGYKALLADVRNKLAAGNCPPCFARDLIELREDEEEHQMSELELATLVSMPFSGGVDTTRGVLTQFMLACCASHETFFAKAQAEVDRIVGSDRLPEYEDLDKMPYVVAVCKEVQRWKSPGPIGVPHACSADTMYEGYLIPAGATVIANTFACHLDKRYFDDPHAFRPERHLEQPSGKLFPNSLGHSNFGYGRRACPGLHVAMDTLAIAVSRLLWTFTITQKAGTPPIDLSSNGFIDGGVANVPKPFEPHFELRSAAKGDLIRKEADNVRATLAASS